LRLTGREKMVVRIGIAVVAVLFLYLFAVEPMVEGQRRVGSQLEAKTLLLGKYRRVLGQRQDLEMERDRLKNRLSSMEAKLLSGGKPPLAAAELQKILKSAAAKAQVNITSERILDPLVRDHYMEIPVEIHVKSTVSKVTQLLFEIENSTRYLAIKEMTIRADHRINPKKITATLQVTGLIRNPETL